MSVAVETVDSNLKSMLHHLNEHVQSCVKNNVAHATSTTNAWRESITQVATAASGLSLLAFQAYAGNQSIPNILKQINASSMLANMETTLTNMKLVFDTPARQKLLREALAAVKDCRAQITQLESKPSGPAPAAAPAAPLKIQHQPLPKREPLPPGTKEEFPVLKKGTSIKPTTFLTFSSAESSASARLGVGGYCAMCNAPRTPDTKFCPSCGQNCNILLG